jgi:stage V sporulation protein B
MTDYIEKSVKGTFIIVVFTFLAALAGYLTRVFLARALTPEEFGLFYSVFTLFMFILIFTDMGYNQSLVKYVPQYVSSNKKKALSKLIKYVINANLILTATISIIIFFTSKIIAKIYLDMPQASNIILLCILILILVNIVGFVQTLFQAFQDMFNYGLFYFLNRFLFFIFVILLFYAGFSNDVKLPIVAYILSCFFVLCLFGYHAYKLIAAPKIENKRFDRKMFLKITQFAIPNMISTIAGTVIGYIDTIILTMMVSLSEVGVYNATISTILILSYFGGIIAVVLFPLVSELLHKKKYKEVEQLIILLYKYSLLAIIPCALIMFFFSSIILRILFGEAFVIGAAAMSILSIGVIFLIIAQVNFAIINGLGMPAKITKITVVAALFNIAFNIILIPYLGINGAALTTTVSYLIMMIWSHIIVSKNMRVKLEKLPSIILSSLIFFASLYFLKMIIHANVYVETIIISIISAFVYVVMLYILKVVGVEEIKNITIKLLKKNTGLKK